MTWARTIAGAVDPGVKERPPVPGWHYVAFFVYAPSGIGSLAIAHAEGKLLVVDLVREQISVDDSVPLLRRYGIDEVTGAPDEGAGDSLAHATCGALLLAEGTAR